MPTELNLRFADERHVIVRLGPDDDGSGKLSFTNPITDKDLRDLQWYVEVYGAHSLGDPDDSEAARIKAQLPAWGKALFNAVFSERDAQRRFNSFQDAEEDSRLLTISAEDPTILGLPWELLHDSAASGGFLFMETPRISIRRRVAGATGGRVPYRPAAKDTLRLLFVVSRPEDAGFLDPRADAQAVLDAIDENAPGCITCEFLRPATLDALVERLEDADKPAVDIIHFDGHGVFDRRGGLPRRVEAARAGHSAGSADSRHAGASEPPADADYPPNTGYLLFETRQRQSDFVSAAKLGANLHRHKIALVILSACQSAAVGGDDAKDDGQPERPMGSVAARLTATGIPSVLAMTHSVLVATTRALFGEFYKEMARHKGIGEALDNARRHLANHPEKYEVQRGPERVWLRLSDWFLPALYQQGTDGPLLKKAESGGQTANGSQQRSNLPKAPEAGFFGRRRYLWHIECWFADQTRRITLTGFGGQGKTALALEAGRWLTRTGLFQAAVFVDYSRVQARDAVAVAVSNIGAALGQTILDAAAATSALKQTPTLLILDNLEALAPESLRELLDTAVPWSETGGSRVLCTTRRPEFGHAAYQVAGTNTHRRIVLDGLGSRQAPDDALEWCTVLMKLPPAPTVPAPRREAIVEVFDRVRFHPLSIRVLAQQLKARRPAELGERLEQLLATAGNPRDEAGDKSASGNPQSGIADTPASLIASLRLSLDQLDPAARAILPGLGVFQGGALEGELLAIVGLGDPYAKQRKQLTEQLAAADNGRVRTSDGKAMPPDIVAKLKARWREELAQVPLPPATSPWPALRRQLEAAALIQPESLEGVPMPFLRFHPTLAPMLWLGMSEDERTRLSVAHRRRYCRLSKYLYQEDNRNPRQARAIAQSELPNLLHAVHAALDAGDPDAVDFVDNVNRFLGFFGLKQEAERLLSKAQAAAEVGSQAWFLAQSNRGEQLRTSGHVAEAKAVFEDILRQLGDTPSHERAVTLGNLGRCRNAGGHPGLAIEEYRKAISVLQGLDPTDAVKREHGAFITDLADALAAEGKYAEARQAYGDALAIAEDVKHMRTPGVILAQLGKLALLERRDGWFAEAVTRYRAALAFFQQLHEPASEAMQRHQLGVAFQLAQQWDDAEPHYREAARIREELGAISGANGAATTWNQLAMVCKNAGRPDAAESWYRKAIASFRTVQDSLSLAVALTNLANLLHTRAGRLAEARQLAEEALAIKQSLDSGAAEIWKTYGLLAAIAEKERAESTDAHREAELTAQARDGRRLARDAKLAFPGTRQELQPHLPLISVTIVALQDPKYRPDLDRILTGKEQQGWTNLVAAIRRILAGERDADDLCATLDLGDAMMVETILRGLADPSTLAELRPQPPKP